SGAGAACQSLAQLWPERPLSSPGARHEQPPRRTSGRDPARAAAMAGGVYGPAAGDRAVVSRGDAQPAGATPGSPGGGVGPRLSPIRGHLSAAAGFAGTLAAERRRVAHSLPDPRTSAGAMSRHRERSAGVADQRTPCGLLSLTAVSSPDVEYGRAGRDRRRERLPQRLMEHYVTLFDSLFLPQGLALQSSLERHASPYVLWILCMDDEAYEVLNRLRLPHVRLLRLAEVETAELLRVKRERSRAEYCWTITPFAPRFVFGADPAVRRVTYVDADLWFRHAPALIFREFERSGKQVLITDHAYAPEHDQTAAHGRYCVQFIT